MSDSTSYSRPRQDPEPEASLEMKSYTKDHGKEIEEKDSKILQLEKQIEEMNRKAKDMEQQLSNKNHEIQILKIEKRRRFEVANKIRNQNGNVGSGQWFDGLVIAVNQKYTSKRYENSAIETFNYIYSPVLGIIRAINVTGRLDTALGVWYQFKTNDTRNEYKKKNQPSQHLTTLTAVRATNFQFLRQVRLTSVEGGVLTIHKTYDVDVDTLMEKEGMRLEDCYLNRIEIPTKTRTLLLETIERENLRGDVKIKVQIRLCERFYEKFEENSNAAIFVVHHVEKIFTDDQTINFN